jgi:hypothetical protein
VHDTAAMNDRAQMAAKQLFGKEGELVFHCHLSLGWLKNTLCPNQ